MSNKGSRIFRRNKYFKDYVWKSLETNVRPYCTQPQLFLNFGYLSEKNTKDCGGSKQNSIRGYSGKENETNQNKARSPKHRWKEIGKNQN